MKKMLAIPRILVYSTSKWIISTSHLKSIQEDFFNGKAEIRKN